eukprot:TRINITY_DN78860_c0_g1_i1.p1 TRINITY_DN78860_c0_g1~~TRINITY_DN78860_c0_g1_i1.p1  ORF type:complete len:350 (+),score=80.81 TRINITY_DN78860_c0_g1_i1:61-1050(+)
MAAARLALGQSLRRLAAPSGRAVRLPQTRFASVSVEEARRREQVQFESARERGAKTVSTNVVDSLFSAIFGLGIACWYFDWFGGAKFSESENLIAWLQAKDVAVVVFELDHVMCCKPRGDKGVSTFELEDYLEGISQDFVEAANALARRGFHLAVVVQDRPGSRGSGPDDATSERRSSWWGSGKTKQALQLERWDGAELARKLVASRCPEALSSFKVYLPESTAVSGQEPKQGTKPKAKAAASLGARGTTEEYMRQIARHHYVPVRRVLLFTALRENLRDSDLEDDWISILVPNAREGFHFPDLKLPEVSSGEGPLDLLSVAFSKVLGR